MKKFIYAANLKCNHTRKSFSAYAAALQKACESGGFESVVFVPASVFGEFKEALWTQGAQNFYPRESGSFTGETGAFHLAEFGIESVLVGHSERRNLLGESEALLREKFEFAVKKGWRVFYCIGENLATREAGETEAFLKRQLENIDTSYERLTVAYEPIWAIGTGVSAKTQTIKDTLAFLRTLTERPLLYGGSVSEKNICDIKALDECDGVLVGTASWEADEWINLIKKGEK